MVISGIHHTAELHHARRYLIGAGPPWAPVKVGVASLLLTALATQPIGAKTQTAQTVA